MKRRTKQEQSKIYFVYALQGGETFLRKNEENNIHRKHLPASL